MPLWAWIAAVPRIISRERSCAARCWQIPLSETVVGVGRTDRGALTHPIRGRRNDTMPTLYALKSRFQTLLRPLVASLFRAGVTANQITVLAAVVSCLVGAAVVWADRVEAFLLLPVWLFVRMALNAMDGMLAREFGQKSHLGAYLNELGDVVADAALLAPFALIAPFAPEWVFVVMILSALSEHAGAMGPLAQASRRYDGPLGKSDRALVFGALATWIGFGGGLPLWTAWIMPVLALLLGVTIINRVRGGVIEAKAGEAAR